MERTCPRHGASKALLASDANEYLRLRRYVSPRVGLPSAITGCCGSDSACCGQEEKERKYGIWNTKEDQSQIENRQSAINSSFILHPSSFPPAPPTCVLLLEITLACNLRCPTCYADAQGHDFMSVETARQRLDAFFRTQRSLDVLMLSGGEPTIHPHFAEMLNLALEYPIGRILVNTNGLRLEQSDELLEVLAAHRDRVELFFSFSSFRADVQARLYGRDLLAVKQKALAAGAGKGLVRNSCGDIGAGRQ